MKILCAEALWDGDISENRTTYRSLLNLVRNETGCKIAYFTFNTQKELDYLFEIFGRKGYDIFYLASHMRDGKVLSGLDVGIETDYVKISKRNAEHLKGKVLHLAGCSSLSEKNVDINGLVEDTGVRILSGYSLDTGTIESSAMEVLYLSTFISEGIDKFMIDMKKHYKDLAKLSGFEIHISKKGKA